MPEATFWDDLNQDLQDPEVAAEFAENAARIQAYDAELNAAFHDLETNSPLEPAEVFRRCAWEATVEGIEDEYFDAHLIPVLGDGEECQGSFEYLLVADFDRPLVQPGALFWVLSETVRRADGRVEGRSQMRFRRAGTNHA